MSTTKLHGNAVIRKGFGFHVGYDFTRAAQDIPITIEREAHGRPFHVVGTIAGDSAHPCGFMRSDIIRVEVPTRAILYRTSY